ncbi:MAG: hypothetical protein DRI65_10190 [Chloroflexota bacterium]|nr:MAG: hypothetical protein DRI65_10190 [Chloroflexota bacterium]
MIKKKYKYLNLTGLEGRAYVNYQIGTLYGKADRVKLAKSKMMKFCDGVQAKAQCEVLEGMLELLAEEKKQGDDISIDYLRGELHLRVSQLIRSYKLRGGIMSVSSDIGTAMQFDPAHTPEVTSGPTTAP